MSTRGLLLASTAACTNANRPSRVPLTGSTFVCGSTLPAPNEKRRSSQLAAAARSSIEPAAALRTSVARGAQTGKRAGALDADSCRSAPIESLGKAILQARSRNFVERAILGVGQVEDVLGAFADGHDLGGVQLDVLLHQYHADIAQQTRPVACGQLQHGTLIALIDAHRNVRTSVEHARLAWRAS